MGNNLMRRRMELMATSKHLYILSGPATYMGNPLTFAGDGSPLARCEIEFSAKRGGSGTPSPTNVRPITGVMAADVWIWSGVGQDEVIDRQFALGGTYYGGTVDLVSGVLTVTMASVDMGTLDYTRETNAYARYIGELPQAAVSGTRTGYCLCECYETLTAGQSISTSTDKKAYLASRLLYVHEHSVTTAAAFKALVSGKHFVYQLAAPQTYHIDPATIRSLNGTTNIWTTMGDNLTIAYWA